MRTMNDRGAGRARRSVTLTGAVLLALTVAPAALGAGAADAAPAPAVPVVGVAAFGIGADLGAGPDGVAVDARGDVFEAAGNQVVEYVRGTTRTSYPKHGVVIGGVDGQGSGLRQLNVPTGVALDRGGNLFVSDARNDRVLEYVYQPAQHRYATTGRIVAGTGTAGSGLKQLDGPGGLAVDAAGNLFVADSANGRVERFAYHRASGRYGATATTVAGRGGVGTGLSQLDYPISAALDARGDLFVADSQNLRVLEYAVHSGAYPASGKVVGGGFTAPPRWLAFNPSGDLFVSYAYINTWGVLEFRYNPPTRSFASSGTQVDSRDMVGTTGLAFDASGDMFAGQSGATTDPNQTEWNLVLEFTYNSRARTFSPAGTVLSQVGRQNLGVSAVALDSHGNLFLSDRQVYEFPVRPATGTYSVRGTVLASSGGALGLDSGNDLFVANPAGPGVLEYRWRPAVRRYAHQGIPVPGATQLAGLDIGAVAFDGRNDLFVASGDQVLEFRHHAGTWAASGTVLATVAALTPFTGPVGLALDAHGDLFVTDPVAGVVREYLYDATAGTYAKAGITVAGKHGELSDPTGVAVDGSGHLFVFDAGNARVVKYTGDPSTGVYGANGFTIFSTFIDNYPESGGVAVDHNGDVFFGNNFNSAVVYKIAAS